ncbi:MAG TPA: hypothetical protein VI356_21370 [Myxococcales bacterium]
MKRQLVAGAALLLAGTAGSAGALTLFSTPNSYMKSGKFYGPGAIETDQDLFPVVIRNMIFVTERDFVTPFFNNGGAAPNILAEQKFRGPVDGRLADGSLINENVDIWPAKIAGVDVLIAVVYGGPHFGEQLSVVNEDGEVVMTMDLAIDFGIGPKGVVHVPFYGTTGTVVVPPSLQSLSGGKGVDQAGPFPSGTTLTGRIGDFNHDGYIDGTLVSVGSLPLDSPFFPGQPYVIARNFETDIAIDGALFGVVHPHGGADPVTAAPPSVQKQQPRKVSSNSRPGK